MYAKFIAKIIWLGSNFRQGRNFTPTPAKPTSIKLYSLWATSTFDRKLFLPVFKPKMNHLLQINANINI